MIFIKVDDVVVLYGNYYTDDDDDDDDNTRLCSGVLERWQDRKDRDRMRER